MVLGFMKMFVFQMGSLFLKDHIERFFESAKIISISLIRLMKNLLKIVFWTSLRIINQKLLI